MDDVLKATMAGLAVVGLLVVLIHSFSR